MESRRDFLKKAALLSGAAVGWSIPESIQRALAIDPETGSTYLDAEHIVILMQENRSFDHAYGTLQGGRGFNDPRAHVQPDLKPVWLQTNAAGETYAPFRLNIKETNVTWIGGLPHGWDNQVDARNGGRYDKWLIAKPFHHKGLEQMPMTMGHYTRNDIPFYYALADAFTICDQHFCSSLTGTYANRNYLWTGTVRAEQSADSKPHLYNEETDFGHEVSWPTFPERLEDAGISWKIYQNELSVETGLKGEEEAWLANFGCNTLEYFTQYHVEFSPRHRAYLEARAAALPGEIEAASQPPTGQTETTKQADAREKKLERLRVEQTEVREGLARSGEGTFEDLLPRAKSLHAKAFCVNENDLHFRDLDTLSYSDGETTRDVKVPKGDVLHQFRQDVLGGTLPTVSWLVGPEHFSDHPASAWYGAWYVSEVLDILTQNPDVWKKTIFILTYDENDGYFDHVPPFCAPDPNRPETGLVSEGIDTGVEYVTREQDLKFRPKYPPQDCSIGLGFRVPMVVASPWSRGGCVNSQVFDHTSILQFLEAFLTNKTGKGIEEPNISAWRRAVCGDMSSIFRAGQNDKADAPPFPTRNEFIEEIHKARYKTPPSGFKALTPSEVDTIKQATPAITYLPAQEGGTRPSCPLPYELYADGGLSADEPHFKLRLSVGDRAFGKRSAGSPFNVYSYPKLGEMQARSYALSPGKSVSDSWPVEGQYHVRVDGPNGFMREFKGGVDDPSIDVQVSYRSGNLVLLVSNRGDQALAIEVADLSYGGALIQRTVQAKAKASLVAETNAGHGWYDVGLRIQNAVSFERRFAGRVETGKWGVTDPAMGRPVSS